MTPPTEVIYLIDTNILFQWLAAYLPNIQSGNHGFEIVTAARIQRFMERGEQTIYVPDLVWAEFLAVLLHKEMDVSGGLDDLRLWFRQRESYIQQMQGLIQRRHRFFQWSQPVPPYPAAMILVRDLELIDTKTFAWLAGTTRARQGGKEKLLDGMDAVILIYLHALATLHPQQRVVLYTADYRVARVLPRVREHHRAWFAQNTDAHYALSKPRPA